MSTADQFMVWMPATKRKGLLAQAVRNISVNEMGLGSSVIVCSLKTKGMMRYGGIASPPKIAPTRTKPCCWVKPAASAASTIMGAKMTTASAAVSWKKVRKLVSVVRSS